MKELYPQAQPDSPSEGLLLASGPGCGGWDLARFCGPKANAVSPGPGRGLSTDREGGGATPHLGLTSFCSNGSWEAGLAPGLLPARLQRQQVQKVAAGFNA